MIINKVSVANKRKNFHEALASGRLLQMPGAYNGLVALAVEQLGFDGIYVSGGVMANTLGLADVGLTTLTEVTQMASTVAKVSSLPTIMDVDTGFGEPMNVVRTIQEVEYHGLAGCHLEDQRNPKRCGHLDNKEIVPTDEMLKKISAAVYARHDEHFKIIVRTDARANEGLDSTLDRIKAYVDAGADVIFPEAMKDEKEFEAVRKAVDVPLLANMTEFGKSKLLNTQELTDLGFNIVIYPVTTQRLAMKNVEDGLRSIKEEGTQENVVKNMQTRKRLYEVLNYKAYNEIDHTFYNFEL